MPGGALAARRRRSAMPDMRCCATPSCAPAQATVSNLEGAAVRRRHHTHPRTPRRSSLAKSWATCDGASCVGERIAIWYWILGLNGRMARSSVNGLLTTGSTMPTPRHRRGRPVVAHRHRRCDGELPCAASAVWTSAGAECPVAGRGVDRTCAHIDLTGALLAPVHSIRANISTSVSRSQRCAGTVSLRWCQNRLTIRGGAGSGTGMACR